METLKGVVIGVLYCEELAVNHEKVELSRTAHVFAPMGRCKR